MLFSFSHQIASIRLGSSNTLYSITFWGPMLQWLHCYFQNNPSVCCNYQLKILEDEFLLTLLTYFMIRFSHVIRRFSIATYNLSKRVVIIDNDNYWTNFFFHGKLQIKFLFAFLFTKKLWNAKTFLFLYLRIRLDEIFFPI